MKITINKHMHALLSKRNAAAEAARSTARTAAMIAQQSQLATYELEKALNDVVSFVSAAAEKEPAEYAGMRFGEEDGAFFLELIEKDKPMPEGGPA